jgi:hypothetical protein
MSVSIVMPRKDVSALKERLSMHHIPAYRLFWHALRLRCPYCGKGRIFSHGFTMNDHCSNCGWIFEREEGYWTGAIAINLVVAEMLAAAGDQSGVASSRHGHWPATGDCAAVSVLPPFQQLLDGARLHNPPGFFKREELAARSARCSRTRFACHPPRGF